VMIADNATTRRGHDNPAALAELLAELAATETGLGAGLGYDGDDLDQLISDLSRTGIIDQVNGTDDAWVGMPEFTPGETPFKIIVNFADSELRDAFAQEHGLTTSDSEKPTWINWHPERDRQDLTSLRYE